MVAEVAKMIVVLYVQKVVVMDVAADVKTAAGASVAQIVVIAVRAVKVLVRADVQDVLIVVLVPVLMIVKEIAMVVLKPAGENVKAVLAAALLVMVLV